MDQKAIGLSAEEGRIGTVARTRMASCQTVLTRSEELCPGILLSNLYQNFMLICFSIVIVKIGDG